MNSDALRAYVHQKGGESVTPKRNYTSMLSLACMMMWLPMYC